MKIDPLDREKPNLKAGEILCDGCWSTGKDRQAGWHFFNFKYCKPVWLCPLCAPRMEIELTQKQMAGL